MIRLFLLLSCLLATPFARCAVTNDVDVITLGRLGTGVSPDGWRVTSVSNYSDRYKSALRFHLKTSLVCSPVFTNTIVAVSLNVASSSSLGSRHLIVTPVHNGECVSDLAYSCECSPSEYCFSRQTAVWPRDARIHAFQISLSEGTSPNWGIREMAVICEERRPPTLIFVR